MVVVQLLAYLVTLHVCPERHTQFFAYIKHIIAIFLGHRSIKDNSWCGHFAQLLSHILKLECSGTGEGVVGKGYVVHDFDCKLVLPAMPAI